MAAAEQVEYAQVIYSAVERYCPGSSWLTRTRSRPVAGASVPPVRWNEDTATTSITSTTRYPITFLIASTPALSARHTPYWLGISLPVWHASPPAPTHPTPPHPGSTNTPRHW